MRAAEVVGTFDERAFQCSFDGKYSGGPLAVQLTPLGMPCVPLLGTYLQEYDPVIPTVLLQCPYQPHRVPEAVAKVLDGASDVSLFVQVHGVAPLNPCQHFTCNNINELSVVMHAFYFPAVGFGEALNYFKQPYMGIFEPHNVLPVHLNPKDVRGSGLCFERLEERDCIIHDDGAYSPANCQVLRVERAEFFSFWIVAREEGDQGRSVASFHWVCGNDDSEERMRGIVRRSVMVEELGEIHPLVGDVIARLRQ